MKQTVPLAVRATQTSAVEVATFVAKYREPACRIDSGGEAGLTAVALTKSPLKAYFVPGKTLNEGVGGV